MLRSVLSSGCKHGRVLPLGDHRVSPLHGEGQAVAAGRLTSAIVVNSGASVFCACSKMLSGIRRMHAQYRSL